MAKRRHWGRIRKMRSGRYQARYLDPDGIVRNAPHQFERRRDAEDWLDSQRAEILQGVWINPDAGKITLAEYGQQWINERQLAETTRERYQYAFDKHVVPDLGDETLTEIKTPRIRKWRKDREDNGVGQPSIAKAYRLMHAIFQTAVDDDELIQRNPCRVPGAGEDGSAEREALTVDEVFALVDAAPPRWRALVLMATFTSLRFGELSALQRKHINTEELDIAVRQSRAELKGGRQMIKTPKSDAGKRSVAVPDVIATELRYHLNVYSEQGDEGFVFVGPRGGILRRRNFRRVWAAILRDSKIGKTDVHFHDLRHTGNQLAAESGATTRELMARLGHSSMRAALIYQHSTRERDRKIAASISENVRQARAGVNKRTDPERHTRGTRRKSA